MIRLKKRNKIKRNNEGQKINRLNNISCKYKHATININSNQLEPVKFFVGQYEAAGKYPSTDAMHQKSKYVNRLEFP